MEHGAMTQGKPHFHKQICILLNRNALNTEMHYSTVSAWGNKCSYSSVIKLYMQYV